MVEAGIEASNQSVTSVISACAKVGNVDMAEAWLDRYEEFKVEPDVIAFSSVIDACAKAGDSERGMRVFERMRAKGVKPNVVAYSALARPIARQGDWRRVEELEAEMRNDGLRMNEYFLYALLDAYACAKPKEEERAERAFRRAMKAGVKANDFVRGALCKIMGAPAAHALFDDCAAGGDSRLAARSRA